MDALTIASSDSLCYSLLTKVLGNIHALARILSPLHCVCVCVCVCQCVSVCAILLVCAEHCSIVLPTVLKLAPGQL